MLKVLIVDDDDVLRLTLRASIESRNTYQVDEAKDGIDALASFDRKGEYDFVILDVNMPRMDGLALLQKIREKYPKCVCLILTAYSNVKGAVAAIKSGAYDYIEKPVQEEQLFALMDKALAAGKLMEEAAISAPQILEFSEDRAIIGQSRCMNLIFNNISRLSKVDTTVLIRGESGTGKELVARALHFNSPRKKGPFVAVNLAAIPETLIESELFGHEKGAFTGADKKKSGRFQHAQGGTLFLDEIGDISPSMQVKILRVLQERRFTTVGGATEEEADVRIIAATNRPLEKMIASNSFRADLFYRLNVMPIQLPSLRDRREDIEILVDHMIKKFNGLHRRNLKGIERDALNALRLHNWPGNIRELENVIEHAFIMEAGTKLSLDSLPELIKAYISSQPTPGTEVPSNTLEFGSNELDHDRIPFQNEQSDLNFPALKEKFEKEFIIKALRAFNGRINQTAEHTQMTKVTLLRKLEKYGINPREYISPRA